MLFLENLKPLKIYKRPLFLPTVEGDKKKKSAIFLLTPNYESSKQLITSNLLINKLRFISYYIEKDLTFFIGKKAMKDSENVSETYIHNLTQYDMYQSLCEMTAAERNSLKDSQFGLPNKRKYPLDTIDHVKSAIKFFNYVDEEDEEELAKNIKKAIKKFKMAVNVGQKNRLYKYINESVLTEKYFANEKDIYYNKDKFDSGEINLCFITGHSGSGKSTMAGNLSSENVESYDLDDVMIGKSGFTMDQYKEYGDLIYSFFNGKGSKYYTDKTNSYTYDEFVKFAKNLINDFVDFAISYAKSHKDKKFIIEGIWLYEFIDPSKIKDYAVYIKGTSAIISTIRSAKRNSSYTDKTSEKIEIWIQKFKHLFFKGIIGFKGNLFTIEKEITNWRKYFSNLVIESVVLETSLKSTIDKDFKSKGKKKLSDFKKVRITKDIINRYKSSIKFLRYIDINDTAYLYFDNNNPVAVVAVESSERDDGTRWITAIEVLKDYQGYGLGNQLLDTAVKDLKGNSLSVAKDNEVAKRMYEKYGFKTSKASEDDVKAGRKSVYFMYLPSVMIESNNNENLLSFKVINNPDKKFVQDHINDGSCIKEFLNDNVRKNSCMFLDTKNNKIACVFMVFNDRGHKIINNLEVLPKYRGKGLSTQLLDYAVKNKGANHLWVNDDNSIARHLYEKYGFEYTGDKYKEDGHTRLYMALESSIYEITSNDPYTNPILEKEWGFTHVDGLYHCLVRVQGINKNLRGRAEMLVLDSTMTKVYLVFDKDGKDYKVPGGGFDCNESHRQSAERETREEARLSTVGVYDTGVRYVKMYDDDPAVRQKEFAEENRFYGAYTEIFIGIATGTTFDEELNTLDVDDKITRGKFYDISEVYDKLKDVHKKALNSIQRESVIDENTKTNISNLNAYHLELGRKGKNPKDAGGWDEELYSKSIDAAIINDIANSSKDEIKKIIDKRGSIEVNAYTLGEDYAAIYLGKISIRFFDITSKSKESRICKYRNCSFDWEWSEQEISDELAGYYKDEVKVESVEYGNSPENAVLSVSALIWNNGKILLENHKKARAYTIPGGKINDGEQPVDALIRELGEELGIKPTEISIFTKTTFECGYPAGSGNKVWFTDYCFDILEYTGEIQNLESNKHTELVWKSFEELDDIEISVLLKKVKSYHDMQCRIMNDSIDNNIEQYDMVTCSGYMDDLKILKYIATPELYKDLLDSLELTEEDFENGLPRLNFIGGDKEDIVIDTINGETNINVCCYSMSKDRLSISQYIKTTIETAIIGIIIAKCPNLSGTIIPMAIAECILGYSGYLAEFATKLIAKYTMRGLITKLTNLDYVELFKDAKEMGINQIKDIDDFKTVHTESSTTPTTVTNLSNKLKYKNSKVKTKNSKLRNTISNLSDSIKDSIKVSTKPTTTSNNDKKLTEDILMSSLSEGSYIINGDYVTIFTEDAANDPALKRILYKERIIKRADILLLLDRVKTEIPEIKYAYPDLDRYNGRNLFIDLYYYNESFFKNNEYNVIKSYSLYRDMISRLINDKRITSVYQRRTVFVPINDWRINPSTRMWFYKENLNPISMIYEMMYRDPNTLKKLFKNVTFVFFDKDKYFTIDINDISNAKRNSIKFKAFITKINKNEEFDYDDTDSSENSPNPEAIKTAIMDKIEDSKGVDLTKASTSLKKDKVENMSVSVNTTSVPVANKDKKEEKDIEKSKTSQNKSIATSSKEDNEEKLKSIVASIDKASQNALDPDDALNTMDDDPDLKELIANLDTMRDDTVNINAARAERMTQLDKELLDKTIKGQSIRDILDNSNGNGATNTDIPSSSLPVASTNEEWNDMKYINFDKTYSLEADLVNVFRYFSKVSRPLSVRDIKVDDNSTSEDRLDLYTVDYEDYRGKRYSIKLDIPKIKNNRFLLRGNAKTMQTQFFNMPIVKTDLDTCQIVTNYKKIIISRYNTSSGKSLPNVSRFMKAINKYTGNKIKVSSGDNTRVCAKYILPVDYIDLSSVFRTVETSEFIFYFDQDELRKIYDVDDNFGVPFAYDKRSKSIVYYPNNTTTPFIDVLVSTMITDEKKYEDFLELYRSAKAPTRMMYTRARIMASDIPLVIVCAYSEGLSKVLKKANINYTLKEKLTNIEKNDILHDYIKFNDGFLYYEVDYCSSLLLNGLKDVDTLSHSFTEIDDKNMYLEFLDGYGGRIKADGLDNFYDCEIDPITEETLRYYKLPTDYISVLLYANYLLSDNKFVRHTDTSSRRARRFELIAAYTYQVLSEAYGTYSNSLKHNRNASTFSCKQSAVIDKILLDPTSSDYSVINVLNDIETTNAITTKGLSGMNSDRSYSLDKRTYDESMVGVVGMSTGFSANVGITRQATLNMAIEGGRGYVKDNKGKIENMNAANTLTATESVVPFAVTHDDPIRVAMTFIQTSKHAVRTEESDPLLVTNGSDEAIPYICSDQFAFKSKNKGTVVELNDSYMIIEYNDENKTKEYINLEQTIEKNSDGGFYTTLKLDADPKLKVGSRVKEGQILAWDRSSMSNSAGEDDNLAYNVGKLAKIAIINIEEGFEDSGICTEEIAKKLACKITNKIDCVLDKHTNIFNVAKVGQAVEQGETLMVWQTPYDEDEVNNLLKALADDKDAVSELGRHTLKSEYTGKIVGLKVYRTVNDDELSDSLKTLVRKYERPISELKKKLKDAGVENSDLPANYPLPATGKLKNAGDGVLIEFYVEYLDTLGVGDKITYNAANKAVIKNIIPEGKEPYTDLRPNEHISAFVSVTSIDKRMVCSTVTYGALQKLMVELDRSCKDIAGIQYDDSQV